MEEHVLRDANYLNKSQYFEGLVTSVGEVLCHKKLYAQLRSHTATVEGRYWENLSSSRHI